MKRSVVVAVLMNRPWLRHQMVVGTETPSHDLFADFDNVDCRLPHSTTTSLVPLVDLTEENGATEFVLRSYLPPEQRGQHEELYQAACRAGSIVIFDARMRHRGLANGSSASRTVLCVGWNKTTSKYWYYTDHGTLEGEFPHGSWRHEKL